VAAAWRDTQLFPETPDAAAGRKYYIKLQWRPHARGAQEKQTTKRNVPQQGQAILEPKWLRQAILELSCRASCSWGSPCAITYACQHLGDKTETRRRPPTCALAYIPAARM
jgi:hypothetical protein